MLSSAAAAEVVVACSSRLRTTAFPVTMVDSLVVQRVIVGAVRVALPSSASPGAMSGQAVGEGGGE